MMRPSETINTSHVRNFDSSNSRSNSPKPAFKDDVMELRGDINLSPQPNRKQSTIDYSGGVHGVESDAEARNKNKVFYNTVAKPSPKHRQPSGRKIIDITSSQNESTLPDVRGA